MPTLARGMQFTENEWAYVLFHDGWRPAPVPTPNGGRSPSLWVRCALDNAESGRDTSSYLQRKANTLPGSDGCVGYDLSASMWNERLNSYAAGLPDAFVLFDWQVNNRATKKWANDHPTDPYGPWLFPRSAPGRNDVTLNVAGIADRVGPEPYLIERSPYWRMKANGVPVHDLPEPPRELWVSPLPAAGLKQGDTGTSTSPLGIAINTLQRRFAFEDCWITKTGTPAGAFNWYYGTDWVRSSLEKHQRRLAGFGLWDGPIDGSKFTPEYRAVWDGALRYGHEIGGT